jgi:DNA-binding winged helix-turn-helix (wHTH) protein
LGTVGGFLGDFVVTLRPVRFGPFTLDTDTRQLFRDPDHRTVHLSPKVYELLCVLVAHRPKVLAKTDLHERLWPSTFVSDATLASLVAELREALEDRSREARYIRTVHGFGYAFAATAHEARARAADAMPRHWIMWNGHEQPLNEGTHLIGRDADVGIRLASPTVSRRHARIVVAGDTATLEDLSSKNGTQVGGTAITAATPLADGDQIRIGAFTLTFRITAGDGSTATAPR